MIRIAELKLPLAQVPVDTRRAADAPAETEADRAAAWRFIDATRLVSITANLGDVKTTITHPGSTTHGRVAEDEKRRAGISDNLIRLAVGLEGLEDLKADMRRGLAALGFGA